MTNRFYSASLGQDKTLVAETSGTTAAAHVEVRVIYDATGLTKGEALKLLEHIENRIIEDTWPPV